LRKKAPSLILLYDFTPIPAEHNTCYFRGI
jgi:hypothetical protein